MNVMIITERPDEVQNSLNHLMYDKHPNGEHFVVIGFEGKAESALTECFDLDLQGDTKRHLLVVADNIGHLWQGMRQLLDIVIETRNAEAEEWLTKLLRGNFP
jgi:hypothetical protein